MIFRNVGYGDVSVFLLGIAFIGHTGKTTNHIRIKSLAQNIVKIPQLAMFRAHPKERPWEFALL